MLSVRVYVKIEWRKTLRTFSNLKTLCVDDGNKKEGILWRC